MRFIGTTSLLIALTVLTGCGSDGDDAEEVPTITTRPSATASSTATPSQEPPSSTTTTTSPSEPTTQTSQPSSPPTETGPSPEPPTDDPVGPTTYQAALARIDARGDGTTRLGRFSTPDDVIYCLLDDPVIGPACELRRGFVKDPDVCGGAAEGVGRIETYQGRARPVCNTDTIREPGAEEVAGDGVVITSGAQVECLVEAVGVTCVDRGPETGFFLAPGEYHTF
ncbi:hypothetical protein [Nocardioides antri]|uniref:Uncharacterized protein n=1 Tax=Nocardioides antri TaxID=2607659 RepID=A0A5B1M7V1_9ACTN|nr:hypothetical protein [Nocardioides antri]KAA1429092.1 hypothetical protein F0U47_02510 [Nocardioides antri]